MLLALLLAPVALAQDEPESVDTRPPEPIHKVYPSYPEEALDRDLEDQVCEVRAWIDVEGVPSQVRAEDCPEPFARAAADALSQWRFKPGQLNGEDAPSQYIVRLEFRQAKPGGPTPEQVEASADHVYVSAKAIHRVPPRYPRAAWGPSLATTTCKVRVFIDTKGKPTEVSPEDCLADFVQPTIDAVMQWRFEPARIDGEPYASEFFVRVVFKRDSALGDLVSEEQLEQIRAAHTLHRDDAEACTMGLTVYPDGSVGGLSSNRLPECMVLPTGSVRVPSRLAEGLVEARTCEVGFDSDRGVAERLDLSACDKDLRRPTRWLVQEWIWNSWEEEAQPYVLTVRWAPAP